MAESSALLPQPVLRALSDKVYDKRKNAAHEVEMAVKLLVQEGNHERINAVINLLVNDFALSSQANHRKGGLIGLAAVTVGLGSDASHLLERIVQVVLRAFSDPDSRVRYYACEALYNIAKVTRGDFIVFFNDVFDALCKLSADPDTSVQSAAHLLDRLIQDIVTGSDQFSVEEFIPLLRERMSVVNQKVQQFLVGWIKVLDSVPDIDMLSFLPDFLDGLFSMLGDSAHEIRVQADIVLRTFLEEVKQAPQTVDYGRMTEILVQRASSGDEFTRLTAITWINEFVKLGGLQLMPYYAAILGAVLPCIADKEEKIQLVAKETSRDQMDYVSEESCLEDGFDIGSVLQVLRRELGSDWDTTRLEALSWVSCLLDRFPDQVLEHLDDPSTLLFDSILTALADPSNEVVIMALEVQARIASHPRQFHRLLLLLLLRFNSDRDLLERRGSIVVRHLALLLDPEKVFRELASILQNESDCDFAATMVQALNLILVATPELADVRERLKRAAAAAASLPTLPRASASFSAPASLSLQPISAGGTAMPSQDGSAAPAATTGPTPVAGASGLPSAGHLHGSSQSGSSSGAAGPSGRGLFLALFPAWCHSPISAISLCLLAQSFELAYAIISGLDEADMSVSLMVQMDKLVHLLETPVFSFLRLKLLDPGRSPALLRALYSLLMLLPQHSVAFKVLRTRLKCVPQVVALFPSYSPGQGPSPASIDTRSAPASWAPSDPTAAAQPGLRALQPLASESSQGGGHAQEGDGAVSREEGSAGPKGTGIPGPSISASAALGGQGQADLDFQGALLKQYQEVQRRHRLIRDPAARLLQQQSSMQSRRGLQLSQHPSQREQEESALGAPAPEEIPPALGHESSKLGDASIQ